MNKPFKEYSALPVANIDDLEGLYTHLSDVEINALAARAL